MKPMAVCQTPLEMTRPQVRGLELDDETRCVHYKSALDVIAIKMRCCDTYFACRDCHAALADHSLEPWPSDERRRKAVLCGACGTELEIERYLEAPNRCPECGTAFNPGCRKHHKDYFAEGPSSH